MEISEARKSIQHNFWLTTIEKVGINELLDDLQQHRESALRPAAKFLDATPFDQLQHVYSEILEIKEAITFESKEKQLDECNDGQISIETLKAIIEPDEVKRRESMIKTIQKNTNRKGGSYYAQP